MSEVAELIADLVAAGVDPMLIGRVAQAMANASAGGENRSARQDRNRRYYEANRLKTSEKRLNSDGGDGVLKPSESVLNRLNSDASTRARVVDNPSRLVLTGEDNLTTLNSACAGDEVSWPECEPPSRADLERLGHALREAAGPSIDPTATKLLILAPILALARHGNGPPCDLQTDVLPTIRALSGRVQPGTVRTWKFFTDAICQARDQRLSGAPKVVAIDFQRGQTGPPMSASERSEQMRREGNRLALEAE